MKQNEIHIEVTSLEVKLTSTFRHASASRDEGESIWVKAERNGIRGFGEGCPRSYVAGDDLGSSVRWAKDTFGGNITCFDSLEDVAIWANENSTVIDRFPSAWCAVEMALIDLFAREKNTSVETLLGLDTSLRKSTYSAVLGDDKTWRFTNLADKYFIRGMTDFKVKVNGTMDRDKNKLVIIERLRKEHNAGDIKIRLDANNLWKDNVEEAISYLKELIGPWFAIEEPVAARDAMGNSRVSTETGLPVILDESLLTADDLEPYRTLPGIFIANIKISRVGGILRSLKLIEALKALGWQIIIGCHVGETSLLTRAGLVAASAAGENLMAHEGAFGDYLVEREPVSPMLKFGRHGILDLTLPYYYKTVQGLNLIPETQWHTGFGMECRVPFEPEDGEPDILTLEMPDGYHIHYRHWGNQTGDDVVIILHGGMSHSLWQAPLATHLLEHSPHISVVAPDRRGCGLNENRGDLGTLEQVTGDVIHHIKFLKTMFKRVHLAGWCQGCQYASIAAAELGDEVSSLILLTPGFFWNERFRSVLSIAENVVFDLISEFNIKPDRAHAGIPIPMEATDFTLNDTWLDFIENDELKTTMITLKTVSVMDEVQELSWHAIMKCHHRMLMIIAEHDRIVDNHKVSQFIGSRFSGNTMNTMATYPCGHAIQFEHPEEVSADIVEFINATPGIKGNIPENGTLVAEVC